MNELIKKIRTQLREKCPNAEFLLVRIFLYSDCPNTVKYGSEDTPHLDTFHAMLMTEKDKNLGLLLAGKCENVI